VLIKLGAPAAYFVDRPLVEQVRVAAAGFGPHDRAAFLERAGTPGPEFLAAIKAGCLRPGEVPVHVIAVGAHEVWGPNENGDSYSRDTCRRYHPTFTKFARWYRDHRHGPTAPRFGRVAASAYDPQTALIHLLVPLYGDKTAAAFDRDLGRVADEELDLLARGKDIPVSKGARVPTDVCGMCKNAARHRGEYCTARTCPAGGCRDRLGQVVKLASGELHRVFVWNPGPQFFDISKVGTPAFPCAFAARPAA
jgi:hypothetical protein